MGEWRLLLDENVDPDVASHLSREDVHVEHVRDALWQGADDRADVLPYARAENAIVVTSDVRDFASLSRADVPAVVLLYDDTADAHRVADGLLALIDAYPGPEQLPVCEVLDDWI